MRRLALVSAVSVLLVLGFGSAYVLAGALNGKEKVHITICHSGSGKNFTEVSPANVGVLLGHAKNHSDDIIPPFVVTDNDGVEVSFPGQNMDKIYGGGYTGAEVLANGCDVPEGPVVTQTETTETSTGEAPVTVTTPDTTVTLPPGTTTEQITVTVTVPGDTTTAAGTTTVVTVPTDMTTTVTLPPLTTTLPGVTTTVAGQTVERPAETVTLPGTTATITASGTTTVVTVTGPNQVVHAAVVAKKRIRATIKTPRRVVHVAGRVYHLRGKGKFAGKRVVVVVSRFRTCPAGTVLYHGKCSAAVRGKG
jgi:hypothetical protein